MNDNVFLPHFKREINKQLLSAEINLPENERIALFNGIERPRVDGDKNYAVQKIGDSLYLNFKTSQNINGIRIVFDRDFTAESISENLKMRVFAMKLHTGKDFKPVKTASGIVSDFDVYADGKLVLSIKENYKSFVKIPLNITVQNLQIKWIKTHGDNQVRIYSFDIL